MEKPGDLDLYETLKQLMKCELNLEQLIGERLEANINPDASLERYRYDLAEMNFLIAYLKMKLDIDEQPKQQRSNMSDKILQPDHWMVYEQDERKKDGDTQLFSCNQQWEVEYLVKVIWQERPDLEEHNIRTAIMTTCSAMQGDTPRAEFVEAVMQKLK